MLCPKCSAENQPGKRFCRKCGRPLTLACPTCGAPVEAEDTFCGECGSALANGQPATSPVPTETPRIVTKRVTERRLVSVLFADLEGFTALSESRDPEEVRDLLSRYFETARSFVERYGGTVEKFIGDAVMAVWGTPVANEDDAERAVRAALDLVESVAELGRDVAAPGLRARAGVLTGEAAVNLAAQGQGMVAGDLVNTASRIQATAEPGAVLVGDSTRRASEAAIAYEDAGLHQLKGKAEPMRLHRAVRVVAGRGGLMKSERLEPAFVGRDRELKLVKDLFHATVDDGKAHLVEVTGIAGIGKSRLGWEFFKYMDGLQRLFFWHRGRCLSYGEGVTYWALAEMVRGRAGILEGEDRASALEKLHEATARHISDPDDRRFVEPRLAHLLGLEDRQAPDKADLFAGWRLFFERLAEQDPVVMVFEDMQWADPSLVDFLDYLLDWSRNHPFFVMTLSRPEGLASTMAKRNATSIYLEPLPEAAMRELLTGFVPGLPPDLGEKILNRAEGVPLYAVETVRMLLDRGLLVEEGAAYRPTGLIEALDVPETLHALIAARLDGLGPEERRLLQDASVLGKTFTTEALAALTGADAARIEPVLTALVRKEVLSVVADPRSPERGQYGFLQDLVRTVAYETLPKRERRAKHLAVAAFFETAGYHEDEMAEVLASHYLDAYTEMPDAEDAAEIKERARRMLVKAGERAASLAANEEARRHYERALGLAGDPLARAELSERAGRVGWIAGERDAAKHRLQDAVDAYEVLGERTRAAAVRAALGEIAFDDGRLESGIREMETAYTALSGEAGNHGVAMLAAQIARLHFFSGNLGQALPYVERALELAEALRLPDVLSQALNTKGLILTARNRPYESEVLLRAALQAALDSDVPAAALRAYNNLASALAWLDRHEEGLALYEAFLALARRVGDRPWEWSALLGAVDPLIQVGKWDEAMAQAEQARAATASSTSALMVELAVVPFVHVHRGDVGRARSVLESILDPLRDSDDAHVQLFLAAAEGLVRRAEGDLDGAVAMAQRAFDGRAELGWSHPAAKQGFVVLMESLLSRQDQAAATRCMSAIEAAGRGEIPPSLFAHHARFAGRVAHWRGQNDVAEARLKQAIGTFRELGMPFWLAVVSLELGELLQSWDRAAEAEPLLSEARDIFTRLRARPWIERLDRVDAALAEVG